MKIKIFKNREKMKDEIIIGLKCIMFSIGMFMFVIFGSILIFAVAYPTGNEKVLGYLLVLLLTGTGLFLMIYSLNLLNKNEN